ncbi:MAG TPA: hypothetical protein VMR21_12875, partial [Vicinamibacteria bacterium]|nr:hypothetical protein [Vicinamibacteria bacterium]
MRPDAAHRPFLAAGLRASVLGLGAGALVLFVTSGPIRVGADSLLWRRYAGGARLRGPVTVPLP